MAASASRPPARRARASREKRVEVAAHQDEPCRRVAGESLEQDRLESPARGIADDDVGVVERGQVARR